MNAIIKVLHEYFEIYYLFLLFHVQLVTSCRKLSPIKAQSQSPVVS